MGDHLVIRGGTVIDGTGVAPRVADVSVIDDHIEHIGIEGTGPQSGSVRVIDASGKVVCPGFIDVHTHDDLAVLRNPDLDCKTSQGVTTVIVGNCGMGTAPLTPRLQVEMQTGQASQCTLLGKWQPVDWETIGEYLEVVDRIKPAVNVATLVPHNTLRTAVCGDGERPASGAEMARMTELVEEAMNDGALGLSTGLIYRPGRAASTQELIALSRV